MMRNPGEVYEGFGVVVIGIISIAIGVGASVCGCSASQKSTETQIVDEIDSVCTEIVSVDPSPYVDFACTVAQAGGNVLTNYIDRVAVADAPAFRVKHVRTYATDASRE